MSSSRVFWLSFGTFALSAATRWAVTYGSGSRSTVSLVGGASAVGMTLIAIYGTLRPDDAGGPNAKSPLTYCAVLAAVLSVSNLLITVR
ncbi:hypothetical protein [Haladaptatus sp. CMAA 1911]|uniref:hypothetical protein n=1 Tax=unclassified Haladaptatus TaxID=2622732 RepID=UPI003755270A